MDGVVRATCPNCQFPMAIPAGLVGQPVKCKSCGAVVRTKGPAKPARPRETAALPPPPARRPAPPPADNPFALDAPPPIAHPHPLPFPADPGPPAVAPEFFPSEATRAHAGRRKYRARRGGRLLWIVVALLVVGGGVTAAVYLDGKVARKVLDRVAPEVAANLAPAEGEKGERGEKRGAGPTAPAVAEAVRGPFPRRLLFVHVGNYLYLNPLTATPAGGGPDTDRSRAHALRLAFEWRVPQDRENNQLFVLSDTARGDPRPPMKGVLVETVKRFCDTSRPQDRVAIYFGGHVVTAKTAAGEAVYLVPIEGDPADPATLIPLADLYALIGGCKAAQRVVIWDVCRFNPERGRQRPGSEPMTEAIAAALAAAPPGVQVVRTCGPGENALEFFAHEPDGPNKGVVVGSSFLEAMSAVGKRTKGPKAAGPNDPLPVEAWSAALGRRVAEVAAAAEGKPKQTVTLAGSAPESLTPFVPGEPAARFEYPPAPAGADRSEVAAVAAEFALPGIKSDDDGGGVGGFPFPAAALEPYKADVPLTTVTDPANKDRYAFRVKVLDALALIRQVWSKDGKPQLRESFVGETNDAVKKEVTKEQDYPAGAVTKLERAAALLEAVEGLRAAQPKRWQAHYDYAVAQTKARIAFLQEYNLALGNIKTDVLPARDPKLGHDGYKLVAAAAMKERSAKKLAGEAQELFDKMADEYKGTPWGVQAKRDRGLNLGLAWQPFNSKAAADKDE